MADKTPNLDLNSGNLIGSGEELHQQLAENFNILDDRLAPLDFIADATDATDVITQLNALLAALQASGTMATS